MATNNLSQDIGVLIAEDRFITDVQIAIHTLMEERGMSRADLARSIGVSEARVSQMFRDSPSNLTAKSIARIFHALGESPELTCEGLRALRRGADAREQASAARLAKAERNRARWHYTAQEKRRSATIGFQNDNAEEDAKLAA